MRVPIERVVQWAFAFSMLCFGVIGVGCWLAMEWLGAQWVTVGASALTVVVVALGLLTIRREFAGRAQVERTLREAKKELELRDQERSAELASTNESLRAKLAGLHLLGQVTRAIGERQDPRSIFQVVVRALEEELPVDFCCLCLYDAARKELTVTCVGVRSEALALELAMTENANLPVENGLSHCVRGLLVYEPDIAAVPFPFPQRLSNGGLRSMVVAPLLVESQVFGVLVAARREPNSFSSGDCEFIKLLGEHTALAAHQGQLHTALQAAYDELRQSQQAMMQTERLRALGEMASGIAHDINNAITPVMLYTEALLEKEPNLSDRARDYLQTMQTAIGDVAHTVGRMREFYRPREPELMLVPVDVNEMIKQVLHLTRARWSDMANQRGIAIEPCTELAENLPDVMGVESEIREALTNLVFNAVDAMPQGGTLTLRTTAEPGSHVCVEVADTGIGMDDDTRRRCLEPFFTTKGERGTGLGLAMVYGIVRRHKATLDIESAVGKGTVLSLTFPIAAAAITVVAPAALSVVPVGLRILLVDDDPVLLKVLRNTLEADSHLITVCHGGQAGIDTFDAALARGNAFDIVISDLGMPRVDGRKVASAVKALAPSMPVILLTGWGQRLIEDGDTPPHVDRVLSKPPRAHELREALAALTAEAIDSSPQVARTLRH